MKPGPPVGGSERKNVPSDLADCGFDEFRSQNETAVRSRATAISV